MRYTTLDTIIRRTLLAKRLPLHYYVEFLVHAATCLRELTFDSLKVVNTVVLEVNDYFAADLPCDFVDWTKVGFRAGQFIMPIAPRDSINRLHAYDAQGQITTYGTADTVNLEFPFWPGYWMFQNLDDLGENTGRLYGWDTSDNVNGFKILKERNQIQFTESIECTRVVMEYISDGSTSDNATQVDEYAWSAIEAFINWKRSPHADIDRSPEALSYFNQRRILRARTSGLTLYDIRQILYKNYRASIKN